MQTEPLTDGLRLAWDRFLTRASEIQAERDLARAGFEAEQRAHRRTVAERDRYRAALVTALEDLRAGNYITAHGQLADFLEGEE